MNDFISREAFIDGVEEWYCSPCKGQDYDLDEDGCRGCVIASVLKKVRDAPVADVEPVRHGEWERTDDDWDSLSTFRCSVCGEEWCFEIDEDLQLLNYNYCPNCGAKMDLEG